MRITSSTIKTDEQLIRQIFSQTINPIRFYDWLKDGDPRLVDIFKVISSTIDKEMCFNAIRDEVTPMGRKAFFPVLLSLFLAA